MRGVVAGPTEASLRDGEELAAALEFLRRRARARRRAGAQGREHLAAHHAWPVVLEQWESLLRRVAPRGAAAA